jgi:hypothetical protein
MKAIFGPSRYDNPNVYYQELDREESIILMRSRIYKINQKILKNGAIYKHVDPSFKYVHEVKREKNDD